MSTETNNQTPNNITSSTKLEIRSRSRTRTSVKRHIPEEDPRRRSDNPSERKLSRDRSRAQQAQAGKSKQRSSKQRQHQPKSSHHPTQDPITTARNQRSPSFRQSLRKKAPLPKTNGFHRSTHQSGTSTQTTAASTPLTSTMYTATPESAQRSWRKSNLEVRSTR